MSILYNCHTDGDNYRITKFNDGEVESSYLCSTTECQCPAGQRPTCRHRLMLPMFINREAVDTFWFLDWERKGWVSNEPALNYSERSELDKDSGLTITTMTSIPKDFVRLNTPPSELDSSNPEPTPLTHEQLYTIAMERASPMPEKWVIENNPAKPSWRRI